MISDLGLCYYNVIKANSERNFSFQNLIEAANPDLTSLKSFRSVLIFHVKS